MNHEHDGDAMVVESPISNVQESSILSTPPTSPHPGLSMTKDAVRISATMSAVGFDIAKRNTDYGFGMTKAFMRSANAFLHENGHVEEGTSASLFLRATEVMMDRAHRVIGQGLTVTHVTPSYPLPYNSKHSNDGSSTSCHWTRTICLSCNNTLSYPLPLNSITLNFHSFLPIFIPVYSYIPIPYPLSTGIIDNLLTVYPQSLPPHPPYPSFLVHTRM